MKAWIEALRLRTLPLSVAGVLIAAGLAAHWDCFRIGIFAPMLLMVLLLQVLANFADEYGDLEKGVDNEDRIGPKRGMQRGEITRASMKRALVVVSITILIVALVLLFRAFGTRLWYYILLFMALGVLCIVGAIKYTVGKGAYGYYALGDLSSFFFFGLLAVMGGFFLYAHVIVSIIILPAVALGCLVVGVLNLNNIRDIENDRACGKTTIAVILGLKGALAYHSLLIALGIAGFLSFSIASGIASPLRYLYVIFYIPLIVQLAKTLKVKEHSEYDKLMKPLSMTTAALALSFALCLGI